MRTGEVEASEEPCRHQMSSKCENISAICAPLLGFINTFSNTCCHLGISPIHQCDTHSDNASFHPYFQTCINSRLHRSNDDAEDYWSFWYASASAWSHAKTPVPFMDNVTCSSSPWQGCGSRWQHWTGCGHTAASAEVPRASDRPDTLQRRGIALTQPWWCVHVMTVGGRKHKVMLNNNQTAEPFSAASMDSSFSIWTV